jgi:hypothetical protein
MEVAELKDLCCQDNGGANRRPRHNPERLLPDIDEALKTIPAKIQTGFFSH